MLISTIQPKLASKTMEITHRTTTVFLRTSKIQHFLNYSKLPPGSSANQSRSSSTQKAIGCGQLSLDLSISTKNLQHSQAEEGTLRPWNSRGRTGPGMGSLLLAVKGPSRMDKVTASNMIRGKEVRAQEWVSCLPHTHLNQSNLKVSHIYCLVCTVS